MKFDRIAFFLVIGESTLVLLALINHGYTMEALQAVVRYSGRLSLAVFSLIFLFHGNERFQLSNLLSPDYFLLFAVAHGIHLIELTTYISISNSKLIPLRLAGGALAYAMIFLMPWFSNLAKAGKMGPVFYKKAGFVYLFYVWLIFFLTYLPRVQGKLPQVGGSYAEHVFLLGVVCMLLGIKIQQMLPKSFAFRKNK
jgi:hypothetical protein